MTVLKKKKFLFIFLFSAAILSIPISIGIYYLVFNKSGKVLKTHFLKETILPSINLEEKTWQKVQKNIFENEKELFFSEKNILVPFDDLNNRVEILKKENENYDFSELKTFLKDIKMEYLEFYDLYFYQKLLRNLNLKVDEKTLEKLIEKHWDSNSSLLSTKTVNDSLVFKLVITFTWSDYLIKKNSKFLNAIKKNIETLLNSNYFDDLDDKNGLYILLLSSSFKIPINNNQPSLEKYFLHQKKEIFLKQKEDKIKFIIDFNFFLRATDFYFSNQNIEIKDNIVKILNETDDQLISKFVSRDIDIRVLDFLDISKIRPEFFSKLKEITKDSISDLNNFFYIEPNIENSFYTLLIYEKLKIKIDKEKILNLLSKHDEYLKYIHARKDLNQWTKEILFNEKIKFLINYEKTEIEKKYLIDTINNISKLDLDYKTIFNLLKIMVINNISNINDDLYNASKEMITSFKSLNSDDKKNITVFIYFVDRLLNINIISEEDLTESITWILNNNNELNYFYKEAIYYFFLSINQINEVKISNEIKKILLENKEKILNSNDKEELFFVDSILRSQYDKL